jgi:hypothetical protein
MAILATSRKWLVTSLCAELSSRCSRQRLASMNSSCGSSIGNRLISSKYRVRPVSPDKMGNAAVWAMMAFLHVARAYPAIAPLLDWIMNTLRQRHH